MLQEGWGQAGESWGSDRGCLAPLLPWALAGIWGILQVGGAVQRHSCTPQSPQHCSEALPRTQPCSLLLPPPSLGMFYLHWGYFRIFYLLMFILHSA